MDAPYVSTLPKSVAIEAIVVRETVTNVDLLVAINVARLVAVDDSMAPS